MDTIHIFGTSGFAREVRDIVDAVGKRSVFIARDVAERDSFAEKGATILEADLPADALLAIGVGDNAVRAKIAARYSGRSFPNLIHPSATLGTEQADRLATSRGVILCAGARLTNAIALGNFVIVNLNATIGHDCIVEDFVNIAPGANISGFVHLSRGCWIGTGAAINQGDAAKHLVVGAETMVGSGSVVVRDCEPNRVYVGIPAKPR